MFGARDSGPLQLPSNPPRFKPPDGDLPRCLLDRGCLDAPCLAPFPRRTAGGFCGRPPIERQCRGPVNGFKITMEDAHARSKHLRQTTARDQKAAEGRRKAGRPPEAERGARRRHRRPQRRQASRRRTLSSRRHRSLRGERPVNLHLGAALGRVRTIRQWSIRYHSGSVSLGDAVCHAADVLFGFKYRDARSRALWCETEHVWLGSETFLHWALLDPDIDIPWVVATASDAPPERRRPPQSGPGRAVGLLGRQDRVPAAHKAAQLDAAAVAVGYASGEATGGRDASRRSSWTSRVFWRPHVTWSSIPSGRNCPRLAVEQRQARTSRGGTGARRRAGKGRAAVGDWKGFLRTATAEEEIRDLREHGRTGRPLGSLAGTSPNSPGAFPLPFFPPQRDDIACRNAARRDARTPPLAGYFFNEIFAGGSFNVPCHWLGKAAFISAGGSPLKVAVSVYSPVSPDRIFH